jgi:hypothetical protein
MKSSVFLVLVVVLLSQELLFVGALPFAGANLLANIRQIAKRDVGVPAVRVESLDHHVHKRGVGSDEFDCQCG